VFDNVTIYPVTDSVSNGSMENLNLGIAGSFPVHWQAYGPGIAYVANQTGEATEGIKSLGLSVFGLGEAGVRSSLIRNVIPGKAYEASVQSKGTGVLTLEFWDAELNLVHSVSKTMNSTQWAKASVEGTAPAGAVYATVSVSGQRTGNVLIDEAAMVPVVKDIHSNVQLLMDDYMIKSASGVERTFYEGKKYTTEGGVIAPVYNGADTYAQIYGTVLYDADQKMYGEADGEPGIYRMWYQTTGYRVAYAESKDGINWVAPKLGLTDFNGSKDNNILNVKDSTDPVYSVFAVFKDEKEADPNRRFKMVTHNRIQSHSEGWYELWASPDGLTWEKVANIMQGQDVANVCYDPVNEVYVGTFKVSINTKRTHGIAISKDLINWTEPVKMFSVDTLQDCADYLRADSYGNGTYALGDSYVGFDWRFLINEGAMGGVADVVLMFSRDLTEDWQRFFDTNSKAPVAISLGENGTFDDGFLVTASNAITVGDETWLYYGGWDGDHGNGISRTAKVGLVKWRLNGFASMDFGSTQGTLETSKFTFTGSELHVNANVAGSLKIELLNENGSVVDTALITGDNVDHLITWANGTNLGYLEGQTVSLRFIGTETELYTFQVKGDSVQKPTATVTFDSGVASQTVEYGAKATKPADPTKTGYTFAGWYNGETAYDFNTAVTGNLTLTAKWVINKYTVSFDSGVAAQTVEYGAKATKPADPVKEGFVFSGWYKGETAYDFNTAVTGSITLTAKWVEKVTIPVSGDENTIHVDVTVEEGIVVVQPIDPDELDKIIGSDVETGDVVIDLSEMDEDVQAVVLPKDTFDQILDAAQHAQNDTEQLVIKLPATTVELDDKTMHVISETVDVADGDVGLVLVPVETEELNDKQQAALKDKETYGGIGVLLVCTESGDVISDFKGGKATLKIPFEIPANRKAEGFAVWYVAEDGTLTKHETKYENGHLVFSTGHFSEYIIIYEEPAPEGNQPGGNGGQTGNDGPSKTGDTTMMSSFLLLAALSITALAVVVLGKKKFF